MSISHSTLIDHLQSAGSRYKEIEGFHGGTIVVLERGSRVLAMIPSCSNENAFWSNPDALLNNTWNVGGDRTWVSPELEYFVNTSGSYDIPSQLDPGSWKFTREKHTLVVTTEQTTILQNRSTSDLIQLDFQKQVKAIPNPFHMNTSTHYDEIVRAGYIGYEVKTQMTVSPTNQPKRRTHHKATSANPEYCNLWSLMQVPQLGTALIPTRGQNQPYIMFGQREQINMKEHSHGVNLRYGGLHSYKLSFNALQSTGRFGYIRRLNDQESGLIIRQFQVDPSGIYPDYAENHKNTFGSCMQFFFDGGHMGGFGELEYHTPAVRIDIPSVSYDTSQVYYFVAKTELIHTIAHDMLGIPIPAE